MFLMLTGANSIFFGFQVEMFYKHQSSTNHNDMYYVDTHIIALHVLALTTNKARRNGFTLL